LGVALLRLDHGGKDLERGQRGSSAKADDVDVVFQLSATKDGIVLKRTHTRVPWVPDRVLLARDEDPILAHRIKENGLPPGVEEIISDLDRLGVPVTDSANKAVKAIRNAGLGHRRQDVLAAVAARKSRS
jgi:hypothetical protein